ncbi:MAG TPA: FAD:protein FMN transferase [Gemmatimonadaceae bacterium]|nr:FAD:protein FMN transferase [Gemmatimonadaceae bacterium]
MSDAFVHSAALMGTVVSIEVVGHGATDQQRADRGHAVERAFDWFHHIEALCTRFVATSEVRQLTAHVGKPVAVSAVVYEVVQFAIALAEESGGAFDPTVGHRMETHGFDREYRTGQRVRTDVGPESRVSYRDVHVDAANKTITLLRPLVLDLGAVAKGLAVDMAARELEPFENFAIDAGGDLYLGGSNRDGAPWSVGIRHPRDEHSLIDTMHVSNVAVCTSGDYERRTPDNEFAHHIIDPRTGLSVKTVASATVVAPLAMVADGLATAAFVLGPVHGLELLERHGVKGLIITPALDKLATQ